MYNGKKNARTNMSNNSGNDSGNGSTQCNKLLKIINEYVIIKFLFRVPGDKATFSSRQIFLFFLHNFFVLFHLFLPIVCLKSFAGNKLLSYESIANGIDILLLSNELFVLDAVNGFWSNQH